jgi:hypothetical protein
MLIIADQTFHKRNLKISKKFFDRNVSQFLFAIKRKSTHKMTIETKIKINGFLGQNGPKRYLFLNPKKACKKYSLFIEIMFQMKGETLTFQIYKNFLKGTIICHQKPFATCLPQRVARHVEQHGGMPQSAAAACCCGIQYKQTYRGGMPQNAAAALSINRFAAAACRRAAAARRHAV